MCVQLEAEAAHARRRRAGRDARGPRAGRGRAAPLPPRRLPPARAAHVPHHRREGVAGPGRSGPGYKAPAVRRRDPRRLRARLHPGRGDPLGRAARARLVDQGQGRRQAPGRGQGLRGRRTATSSRSASTSRSPSRRPSMAWLLRDGEVLASLEVARRPRAAAARACSAGTAIDGALLLRPARSVHTLGMRFPIDVAWCDRDLVVLRTARAGPPPAEPPGAAGPRGARGRGRRVRPLGPAPSATSSRSARRSAVSGRSSSSARRSATSATCRPARSRRWPRPTPSAARTPAAPAGCSSTPGVARRPAHRRQRPHRGAARSPGVLERLAPRASGSRW